MNVAVNTAFEATAEFGETGLLAGARLRIDDNQGNTVLASQVFDRELGTTGVYAVDLSGLATAGQYTILASSDGSFDPETVATEDLLIYLLVAPDGPPLPVSGSSSGLCSAWIDGDSVAECCSLEVSSGVIFDEVAIQASDLLFELSGRLFSGECSKTVRPACDNCLCGYQVLSRGHIVGPWDWGGAYSSLCDLCLTSCSPSRVKLSGYPIREITEIKIDGDVLASSEYTLWKNRYVTRLNNGRWPLRQNLTLPDTEDGTFSISYSYGADPPDLGIAAAAQLGCEIYKACANATGSVGACALPTGVTRITRQGVTIEKLAFTTWAFREGTWRTGLSLVDAFLGAYNQAGLMRRPVFWSPGRHRYAQPFG